MKIFTWGLVGAVCLGAFPRMMAEVIRNDHWYALAIGLLIIGVVGIAQSVHDNE